MLIHRILAFTLVAIIALARTTAAQAAIVTCIDPADGSGLTAQQQLDIVLSNWQVDSTGLYEIHIVKGTHVLSGSQQYSQGISGNNGYGDLNLRGGYDPGCHTRTLLASNTVLTGNLTEGFFISAVGNMLVEGLTFDHISSYGLQLEAQGGLEVRNIIVRNMDVGSGSGNAIAIAGYDNLLFRDSLVYGCNTKSGGFTGTAVYVSPSHTSSVIKHVTIANNAADGLEIYTESAPASVTDTIIWGNSGYDILAKKYHDDSPNPTLSYSDYLVFSAGWDIDASSISADPLFINPAAGNFALKTMIGGSPNDSPAINTGTLSANCPSCEDLSGNPRYVGSRVDMGAYESVVDDRTDIVVTTTLDNGDNDIPTTGSLRAAIKNANASAGVTKITFGGSLTCPQTFFLNGALPDIKTQMTIDATTLTGWTPNTLPSYIGQFNANLCVYLDGAGSVPVGLHVPASASSAQLSATGLLMFGFTDAAIKLEGGSNHHITGSQFGGAFLIANNDGIRVTGSSGAAFVGGYDDASVVNLFGGATHAGIYVDSSTGGNELANNVIGFRPDGAANGNGTGIVLSLSPNNIAQYNTIGNNANFGVQILGPSATGNVLQYNSIGTASTGNAGGGVEISFGAAGNTIGAPATLSYGGNSIYSNDGPGVWISGGAFGGGIGNRILGNSMAANSGLAIDLGSLGPDANDVPALGLPDQDTGPNDLQNYPVITHYISTFNLFAEYQIDVTLASAPNTTFRLDFYSDVTCTGIGSPPRGDGLNYLGHTSVTTGPTGSAAKTVYMPLIDPGSQFISATATAPNGDTSEIGPCARNDQIFKNGFD